MKSYRYLTSFAKFNHFSFMTCMITLFYLFTSSLVNAQPRNPDNRRPGGGMRQEENKCIQKVMSGAVEYADNQSNWNIENARMLCQGTRAGSAPVACFMSLIPGCTIAYAQGQNCGWQWQNAISLCKGTSNAFETLRCFSRGIERQGQTWEQAIANCSQRY